MHIMIREMISLTIQNKGKCIGKLIHNRIPIEWMRYNMYIKDDRYRNIPMLVFRVQDSCPENLIDNLKECVDTKILCLGRGII